MADEKKLDFAWPPMAKRKVMGQRISRLDGHVKSSGKAKYNTDQNLKDMLHAVLVTSPHAHSIVRGIDTSAAQSMKGVHAVRVIAKPGTELQWAGADVAVVAAETEEVARDAARAIKVDYEVREHVVREEDLAKTGKRARPSGERVEGDPEKAFQEAEVVSEGQYGIPVITHCCLEPHGQVIQWQGDKIEYWPSTQGVSVVPGDLAKSLQLPATQVHSHMDYMGGGFGSKFPADLWGVECARLSKESGGRPVKLFLDRATELTTAGVRQSAFAKIKIGGKKDGTITAWESNSWATGGFTGGGMPPIPYVFTKIPNSKLNHTAVSLNAGGARAWRAPNHQQASFLTWAAIDDWAAKAGLDPLEVLKKNADLSARGAVYRAQLDKGAELIGWKKLWHPRGDSGKGYLKRGVGVAMHTWGGQGGESRCKATIHPDGSCEVFLGAQDLGTGTRTVIAMVAAETYGLPVSAVKVNIGDNSYPFTGASGGSITVGGVSTSTRRATVMALDKLFEKVAPGLGTTADKLEAVDGRVQVKGNPAKGLPWKDACRKLGTAAIEEASHYDGRNTGGLTTGGVGGIQMADVTVDSETGRVKLNKLVAVQDCGLIVNPKTAESQVYGACIMSICAALMEERIMDQQTGRVMNADMEFYKLAGIGDIGDIVVHMDIREEHDKRGVIGLGEPPSIGGIAAIANATANAIGVRVPEVPLTPYRVLAALERRTA